MNTATLKYFTLSEKLSILSGTFVRKVFGPHSAALKLLDNKALIEQVLSNGGTVSMFNNGLTLTEKNNNNNQPLSIHLRNTGADEIIYRDIIQRGGGDYSMVPKLASRLNINIETIIDAGANIGTATAYFKSVFPNAKVVCIEPEPGNYQMLKNNIQVNGFDKDVQLCQAAFWINNDELNIGIGIRGTLSKELSFGIVATKEESIQVNGITFKDCMLRLNTNKVNLVKIDVEGAEAALLDDEEGFKYMVEHTDLLAIEIHDEAVDVFKFYDRLESLGMRHMHTGETTYCWIPK